MSTATLERAAPPRVRAERIADHEQLAAIAEQWRALAGDVPFCRPEWLIPWWRNFRTSRDELLVLAVRDGDRLIGLAPWYLNRSPIWGRVIRFLGSGPVYSDYLTLLAAEGTGCAVADAVSDWLADDFTAFDSINLDRIRADDETTRHIIDKLGDRGCRVVREFSESCWRVELPEAWEDYLMRLSKTRRERVRQMFRRKFDTGRAVLFTVDDRADLVRGMEILEALHCRRRAALGQRDCFASRPFRGFLHEASLEFLLAGRLRLQWVELDGRPVAVEFDLAGGDTVYFYQGGMEPDVASERPGWLGTIAALKRAFDEGYRYFDFLGGNESYKSHWRAEEQTICNVRITPPTTKARLQECIWNNRKQLKRWLKKRLTK